MTMKLQILNHELYISIVHVSMSEHCPDMSEQCPDMSEQCPDMSEMSGSQRTMQISRTPKTLHT